VFFHESSAKDHYWEIRIYGDEDKKCRELAEELAYICAGHPLIKERVLNFKQGSKKMILLPDRERFSEAKIGFSNAAAKVRLGVYGPVAYKRIDANGEIDVRIRTNGGNIAPENVMRQSREGALGVLVSVSDDRANKSLRIDSLMQSREEVEPSSIRRIDRRRTASITITTGPMDPRQVKKSLAVCLTKWICPPAIQSNLIPTPYNRLKIYRRQCFHCC